MRIESGIARIAAGLIAAIAWGGLLEEFMAVTAQGVSAAESAWIILRYFTVLTNLLAAVVLTGVAFGLRAAQSQRLLALLALSILFVGVVYVVLLRGPEELSGKALIADIIMHYVVPSLIVLFWLLFAPKGALRWSDALLWSAYPLAYFVYAPTRGALDGIYPYPFMDVPKAGWASVFTAVVIILALYILVGLIFVWLGRRLDGPAAKRVSTTH
jgi:hypothetical protein